jgi:general secretion pathway protein I
MNSHGPKNGFTLLEVMVALAIVATAFVTLLSTHLISLDLAQKHKERSLAAQLGRMKMDESLAVSYDSLVNDFGDFAPEHPELEWEIEVEEAEIENLKKVKIIIKMPGGDFVLDTLVARIEVE